MVESSFSNEAWFERALKCLPGGVSSPVRSFAAVGGTPYVVARGSGAYIWDVEGTPYLDYVQSYGASILGHANPKVVEAICAASEMGTTFGAPTPGEIELAEEIVNRVDGLEMVRFVSSGTEAVMSAIRLARGATRRRKIVIFSGGYHGHSDAVLASGGSGVATLGVPSTAGVLESAVEGTLVVPYNSTPLIDKDVACVIVEPVAANMGLVAPQPNWLQDLRKSCDSVGALLIFDEVITGFRLSFGGASSYYGVIPDIWCFGKVIGGGLPLAAFGARRELMEYLAPKGPIYQAGTLSGNPLAVAAGKAVLSQLTPDSYEQLEETTIELSKGLNQVIGQRGIAVRVPRAGTLLGIFFSEVDVNDFVGAKKAADTGRYRQFFHAMLKDRIALAPGAYEIMFPSLAHTKADITRTIEAADSAAASMAMHSLSGS